MAVIEVGQVHLYIFPDYIAVRLFVPNEQTHASYPHWHGGKQCMPPVMDISFLN